MKYKPLVVITLKVLSIFIFIQALIHLSSVANYFIIPLFVDNFNLKQQLITLTVTLGPFAVLMIFGILLWIYSENFSKYIIPKEYEEDTAKEKYKSQDIQAIAFSVVGMIVLVDAIPEIFAVATNLIRLNEIGTDYATDTFRMETIFSTASKLVKLLLGFVLIFGSKGLSGMLKKIRSWG